MTTFRIDLIWIEYCAVTIDVIHFFSNMSIYLQIWMANFEFNCSKFSFSQWVSPGQPNSKSEAAWRSGTVTILNWNDTLWIERLEPKPAIYSSPLLGQGFGGPGAKYTTRTTHKYVSYLDPGLIIAIVLPSQLLGLLCLLCETKIKVWRYGIT